MSTIAYFANMLLFSTFYKTFHLQTFQSSYQGTFLQTVSHLGSVQRCFSCHSILILDFTLHVVTQNSVNTGLAPWSTLHAPQTPLEV